MAAMVGGVGGAVIHGAFSLHSLESSRSILGSFFRPGSCRFLLSQRDIQCRNLLLCPRSGLPGTELLFYGCLVFSLYRFPGAFVRCLRSLLLCNELHSCLI